MPEDHPAASEEAAPPPPPPAIDRDLSSTNDSGVDGEAVQNGSSNAGFQRPHFVPKLNFAALSQSSDSFKMLASDAEIDVLKERVAHLENENQKVRNLSLMPSIFTLVIDFVLLKKRILVEFSCEA